MECIASLSLNKIFFTVVSKVVHNITTSNTRTIISFPLVFLLLRYFQLIKWLNVHMNNKTDPVFANIKVLCSSLCLIYNFI